MHAARNLHFMTWLFLATQVFHLSSSQNGCLKYIIVNCNIYFFSTNGNKIVDKKKKKCFYKIWIWAHLLAGAPIGTKDWQCRTGLGKEFQGMWESRTDFGPEPVPNFWGGAEKLPVPRHWWHWPDGRPCAFACIGNHHKFKYSRSLESAPSISAILGLVLIEKLPRSSLSALFELIWNSTPSISAVFVGPKRALSEDLV